MGAENAPDESNLGKADIAYWEIASCYSSRLRRLAMRLCQGNDELARDLTQQTLANTARCDLANDGRDLWPLFRKIMLNAYIDRGRLKSRETALPEIDDRVVQTGVAEHTVLRAQLHQVLAALPSDQVQLLQFVYREGYSLDEVATKLRLTPEAVKQRLKRARGRFKSIFEHQELVAWK